MSISQIPQMQKPENIPKLQKADAKNRGENTLELRHKEEQLLPLHYDLETVA